MGGAGCFSKVERLSVLRSPCREQSHPSPLQANARSPKNRCASPLVDPVEVRAKLASVLDRLSATGGEVRSGIGNGVNRSGLCRGSHRRRIRMRRAPAVGAGITTTTHEKRVRKDWMAFLLEPAATSASPLRTLLNLSKRHSEDSKASMLCDARSSENSGTQRRTLATIRSESRPCSDCPSRRSAKRPFVARRSFSCRRLAQGSGGRRARREQGNNVDDEQRRRKILLRISFVQDARRFQRNKTCEMGNTHELRRSCYSDR